MESSRSLWLSTMVSAYTDDHLRGFLLHCIKGLPGNDFPSSFPKWHMKNKNIKFLNILIDHHFSFFFPRVHLDVPSANVWMAPGEQRNTTLSNQGFWTSGCWMLVYISIFAHWVEVECQCSTFASDFLYPLQILNANAQKKSPEIFSENLKVEIVRIGIHRSSDSEWKWFGATTLFRHPVFPCIHWYPHKIVASITKKPVPPSGSMLNPQIPGIQSVRFTEGIIWDKKKNPSFGGLNHG